MKGCGAAALVSMLAVGVIHYRKNVLWIERFHDFRVLPELLMKAVNLGSPLHVCLYGLGIAAFVDGRWHSPLVVFHLHERNIDVLNVSQSFLAIGN